jgi:hypothetical protein
VQHGSGSALEYQSHVLIIQAIMDKYPRVVARFLHALTQSAPQEASKNRIHNVPDWWKGLEAALALLGGLADDIRDVMEEEEGGDEKSIQLGWVFESVIPGLLDQSGMSQIVRRGERDPDRRVTNGIPPPGVGALSVKRRSRVPDDGSQAGGC